MILLKIQGQSEIIPCKSSPVPLMLNTSAGRQSEPEPGSGSSGNKWKCNTQEVFVKKVMLFYFCQFIKKYIPGSHLVDFSFTIEC